MPVAFWRARRRSVADLPCHAPFSRYRWRRTTEAGDRCVDNALCSRAMGRSTDSRALSRPATVGPTGLSLWSAGNSHRMGGDSDNGTQRTTVIDQRGRISSVFASNGNDGPIEREADPQPSATEGDPWPTERAPGQGTTPPKRGRSYCPAEADGACALPIFCHVTRASITPAAPATLTRPTHDLVLGAAPLVQQPAKSTACPVSASRGLPEGLG
jgi:hypothetical protein